MSAARKDDKIENPFITQEEKQRDEEFRQDFDRFRKKHTRNKEAALALLVELGTHDKEGKLTKHYKD